MLGENRNISARSLFIKCTKIKMEEGFALGQLYKDYQTPFVNFANSYVRDWIVAEDITEEAIIYYWENKSNLSEVSNVPAYILATIKNKSLNYLRHLQKHEEFSEHIREYNEWELNTRIASLEACEPYELLCKEIQEIVRQTLDKLPERTREIFILSRYKNKSYKEIAELTGITTKGVDFHIGVALKALQSNLKDYFPFYLCFFLNFH